MHHANSVNHSQPKRMYEHCENRAMMCHMFCNQWIIEYFYQNCLVEGEVEEKKHVNASVFYITTYRSQFFYATLHTFSASNAHFGIFAFKFLARHELFMKKETILSASPPLLRQTCMGAQNLHNTCCPS